MNNDPVTNAILVMQWWIASNSILIAVMIIYKIWDSMSVSDRLDKMENIVHLVVKSTVQTLDNKEQTQKAVETLTQKADEIKNAVPPVVWDKSKHEDRRHPENDPNPFFRKVDNGGAEPV